MARPRIRDNQQENIPETSPNNKPRLADRFNNITSIIIGCVTIFGFGYGAASVVCSINHKIEIMELNNLHDKEIEEITIEYKEKLAKEQGRMTQEDFELFMNNYNKRKNEKK